MEPRKLNLAIATYAYGGNGGVASEHPSIRKWMIDMVLKAKKDERIGWIETRDFSDTPITMTRNQSVLWAREAKADVLLMIDSDNQPDFHLREDATAKPFFDSTFDFLYKHYDKGPCVVGAPYCGPPPFENVYVFRWANWQSMHANDDLRIEQYTREEASMRTGIEPVAALPTGCIMWDMRAFELTDPKKTFEFYKEQGFDEHIAGQLTHGWFYYEMDLYESKKQSTEDVTATRDVSFAGSVELGYSPVYVNWDAWAGHWKPKCVGKPRMLTAEMAAGKFRAAVLRGRQSNEHLVNAEDAAKLLPKGKDEKAPPRVTPQAKALAASPVPSVPPPKQVVPATAGPGHVAKLESDGPFEDFGLHTPQEDLTALTKLVRQVANSGRDLFCVEIGSWTGASARAIVNGFIPKSEEGVGYSGGWLYCFDTWTGTPSDQSWDIAEKAGPDAVFNQFCKNMAGLLHDVVYPRRMSSLEGAKRWKQDGCAALDFIYIDGDHTPFGVQSDILAWLPMLSGLGVMAGHDYITPGFSVKQAVHDIFGDIVHSDGNIWYVNRREIPQRTIESATNFLTECLDAQPVPEDAATA